MMDTNVTIVLDNLDGRREWVFENVPWRQWLLRADINDHPYIECCGRIVVGRLRPPDFASEPSATFNDEL